MRLLRFPLVHRSMRKKTKSSPKKPTLTVKPLPDKQLKKVTGGIVGLVPPAARSA
jgi:hypothetical protein